jgi:membrane protein implicated in regulation of membrane protease activity
MLVVWLVLGLALLAVEAHHLAFYSVFVAIGAFAAAIVALFAPGVLAAQVATAVAVSALGIVLLRPFVRQRFQPRGVGRLGRGVHGSLVGEEVVTLDEVGDTHHVGHVRLAGERWLAVAELGEPIPSGTRALVTTVRGTTLVVIPVDADGLPTDQVTLDLPPGPPKPLTP